MADVGVALRVFLAVVYVPAAVFGYELVKGQVQSSDGTPSAWARAVYAFLYVPFVASLVVAGPGMFRELPPAGRVLAQVAHTVAATVPLVVVGLMFWSLGMWKYRNGFMMGGSGGPKDLLLGILGAAMAVAGVVHSILVWVPSTW